MSKYAVFGQELYFDESVRAIESLSDASEPDRMPARIAELLPHASEKTRRRVASKIIQRFFRYRDGTSPTAFFKLINTSSSEIMRRQLLYWRTARTDAIIAAIAREVFHPYFVMNSLPKGYDEDTFRMANTGTLFTVDQIISRDFAIKYARKMWEFESTRTVTLALRIMRQAEMLGTTRLRIERRYVLGYFPQTHPMGAEVFAYCLHDEFHGEPSISLDRVHNADCVKLFFLSGLQADALLKSLEKRKVIKFTAMPGGRHVKFTCPSSDSLVDLLLSSG